MSVICWYCDVRPLSDPALFARGMTLLPWEERREKVMRFHFERDRRLCLGAGLLLAYALRRAGAKDLSLCCLSGGKPVLIHEPCIHFNLSHSGNLAVCAVSDQPVGADVEMWQDADPGVAALCFRAAEREWMNASGDNARAFAWLWTRKESYLKLTGDGLSRSPDSLCVLPGREEPTGVRYTEKEVSGHQICVCTQQNNTVTFKQWNLC